MNAFCYWETYPIHDSCVRFHKLVNDMKITQLNIPTHQMNTKFVNNLLAYWGKYVTNVKQNMDISTTPYVQIYTHLKAYEPSCTKRLSRTGAVYKSLELTQLIATKTPDANLLSGFEKPVSTHPTTSTGLLQLNDSMLRCMMNATAPMINHSTRTTTNMFQANHEDAYDSDVDEGPNAAVAFMANLSSTSATNNSVNEVHSNDNQIFDNVDYQLNQEMHPEENNKTPML
ncbi:hypothetical protein Tco_0810425 [Tanacetum coccineum]